MCMVIDRIPDSKAFLRAFIHFFSDETVKNANSAMQGVHSLSNRLLVPAALVAFLSQQILHLLPCRPLILQGLVVGSMMIFSHRSLFGNRVVQVPVCCLSDRSLTLNVFCVHLVMFILGLSVARHDRLYVFKMLISGRSFMTKLVAYNYFMCLHPLFVGDEAI